MPRWSRGVAALVMSLSLVLGLGAACEAFGQQPPDLNPHRVVFMQETAVVGAPEDVAFERFLRERLRQPVTLRFEESRLRDVVAELQRQSRIPMDIDTRALEDAGLDGDTPVTFHCDQLAARHALDLMLSTIDLGWCSKHHTLLVTTKERVDEHLTMRVYPVADLVFIYGDGGPNYSPLVDLIGSIVAPETWDTVGGQSAIRVADTAVALVISQTREVHEEIEDLLIALRETRQAQGLSTASALDALRQETQPGFESNVVSDPSDSWASDQYDSVPNVSVAVPAWQQPRLHE